MDSASDKSRAVANATKSTVGSVLDTCLAALQTLSASDRDAVVLAIVATRPPRGMRKLAATIGGNTTVAAVQTPPAKSEKKFSSPAKPKKAKQAPPAAKAWSKDPAYVALKAAQAEAAKAVKAAAAQVEGGKLPDDHELVVRLNDARTAVQNFRA